MSGLLDGRVALVTVAAGRIGRANAMVFAREGATVVATDLDDPRETAALLELGEEFFAPDVTDEAAVNAVVDAIVARQGRLGIAFNDAGISLKDLSSDWIDLDRYDRIVAVNQREVMLCMTAELRQMARQGSGAIVDTASVAGLIGLSGAGYCGSKHAFVGLTRSAAITFAQQGIRINAVCPAAIETPMTAPILADEQGAAFLQQMSPMGRVAKAKEVAEAVLFVASDMASFITGHPLAVDGGFVAR